MFKLKFRYRFEAAHRFTKAASIPCQTPHGHTWHATLCVSSESALNSHQMVEEFGSLKKQWKRFLLETVDHSFLHHHEDPILTSLRTHIPAFRGLPFPGDPTTELIAACFLKKAHAILGGAYQNSGFEFAVEIEETPTNSVQFLSSDASSLYASVPELERFTGWWDDPDIASRWIESRRSERPPMRIEKTHEFALEFR